MKEPIVVNGRVYTVWQQLFLDKKEEWIGGDIKEYDRDVDDWAKGKITAVSLEPNGKESAMLCFQTDAGWSWSCDVHYFGLSGADSGKGFIALASRFGSTVYLKRKGG